MKDSTAPTSVFEEIAAFNRGRDPKLLRLKYQRMARGLFPFFRGTDHRFATFWRFLAPVDVGPPILICGDLHLENFGGYRSQDGDFLYDINDFDEALIAPCSLDLVRCTTSILLAGQEWDQTPVQAMRNLLAFLDRYRKTVATSARTGRIGSIAVGTARGPVWGLLQKPFLGDQERFIEGVTKRGGDSRRRRFKHASGRFQAADRDRVCQVREAVELYGASVDPRGTLRVEDVAVRIAGTGSLGLERYAVLVREDRRPGRERLLDIKEIGVSALRPCSRNDASSNEPESEALRAVHAQLTLQAKPAAGLDVIAIASKPYRVRDLIPEENRTGLDRLRKSPKRLRRAVAIAGRLTAWAHMRGSRAGGDDRSGELARWAAGPALDAVIASAVRYAERTRRDFKAFRRGIEHLAADVSDRP